MDFNDWIVARKLTGKRLRSYKKFLSLNKLQNNVLIGTLLGDASMSSDQGKPIYSVKFEQKHMQIYIIIYIVTRNITSLITWKSFILTFVDFKGKPNDVDFGHPRAVEGLKGLAVLQLKSYVSWV